MSASSSSREREPPSRITRSQFASSTAASELFSALRACSSSRSPRPADSSYCMVFRKWRMLERAFAGAHVLQPAGVGLGVAGGDDLDAVAVAQFGAQRHQLAVDLGRHAAVADVGVHRVGEIHRGRAARQRQDPALGREDVDLVGEEVDLHVLEEFLRVARLVLDLEQRLQPAVGLLLQLGELVGVVLVEPVRGDARLGQAVHLLGADLHLDRDAVGADQVGVDRLVAVRLRDGDVVLELARDRLVERVQRAEREVARRDVLDHHARAEDVVHFREGEVLLDHLAVGGVDVLLAPEDLGADVALGELALDRVEVLPIISRRLPRAALVALASTL